MATPMQHKITDSAFHFRECQPIRFIEWERNGASSPMRAECIDQLGQRVDCVIKLKGNQSLPSYAPLFETVAAWLACQLEIPVAEPVLINVTEPFVQAFQGKTHCKWLEQSLGANFGTIHLGHGLVSPPKDMFLSPALQEQAMKIFIFDLLIQNVDRNHRKPNMLTDQQQLFIFDHEKAFSFATIEPAFLRPSKPWLLSPADLTSWVGQHFFHKALQDGYNKWRGDVFMQTLNAIDTTFWLALDQHLPPDWRLPKLDDLKTTLNATIQDLNGFSISVQQMLDIASTQTVST